MSWVLSAGEKINQAVMEGNEPKGKTERRVKRKARSAQVGAPAQLRCCHRKGTKAEPDFGKFFKELPEIHWTELQKWQQGGSQWGKTQQWGKAAHPVPPCASPCQAESPRARTESRAGVPQTAQGTRGDTGGTGSPDPQHTGSTTLHCGLGLLGLLWHRRLWMEKRGGWHRAEEESCCQV